VVAPAATLEAQFIRALDLKVVHLAVLEAATKALVNKEAKAAKVPKVAAKVPVRTDN